MVSAKTVIVNEQGMHMRPAQLFVTTMSKYPASVNILFNGKTINAKSIMMLMSACLKRGSEIEVQCDGQQEEEALKEAISLIESGLGE